MDKYEQIKELKELLGRNTKGTNVIRDKYVRTEFCRQNENYKIWETLMVNLCAYNFDLCALEEKIKREESINKFLNANGYITNELFLELLEENNIKIHARTKCYIKNSLEEVSINNYKYKGNKSNKIFELAEKLQCELMFKTVDPINLDVELENIKEEFYKNKLEYINFMKKGIIEG